MLSKIQDISLFLRVKDRDICRIGQYIGTIITFQQAIVANKSRNNLIKAYTFLLILNFLLPTYAHADTNLTFCYDPYPPYTLGSEGKPLGGLKVKLLQTVVDRIDGVTADVVLLPWKRCQAEARKGVVDGILPLFKNEEREAYLTFTNGTFLQSSNFWYTRARFPDGLDWNGELGELSHLRLGMVNGSIIDEDMETEFTRNHEITRARNAKALMQILLKGRVDLVAIDGAVGRYTAQTNGWQEQIDAVHEPISSKLSYFGLSKANGADKYLDKFNDTIEELETDGMIEEILYGTNYSR